MSIPVQDIADACTWPQSEQATHATGSMLASTLHSRVSGHHVRLRCRSNGRRVDQPSFRRAVPAVALT